MACYWRLICQPDSPPLVVDLGFGASPVTTIELYERLRVVRPDVQVVGLDIDHDRVERARQYLHDRGGPESYPGLSFALGGFELPVPKPPIMVRAFNVLRQYEESDAWEAWRQLCLRLAPGGILVEGTCDEVGRRAVWVTLTRSPDNAYPTSLRAFSGARRGTSYTSVRPAAQALPLTITFAAHLPSLPCPSELAERLPKTLIHRNVPGENVHRFLQDFDRCWAMTASLSVFGPRQRWIAAVELLAKSWPVITNPPLGGRKRWRLGELSLPWAAVAPALDS